MTYYTEKENNSDIQSITWQAPSNIALVKYWGKYATQLPCNPSLSFTLNKSHTISTLKWMKRLQEQDVIEIELYFHDRRETKFEQRMSKFFNKLAGTEMPFLKGYRFCIETENSFPHSAGIASSASAMASIALCLCSFEKLINNVDKEDDEQFFKRASHIARLGSGSASRSTYPVAAWWGKHESMSDSSQEFAVPFKHISHDFKEFCDSILIVSSQEKSVSSSVGHQLMNNHPMAAARFERARQRINDLKKIMQTENMAAFGEIVEAEALELHALMMTSTPSFILMMPESLKIINEIYRFRELTNLPVYFTLDAGPNIHLLYPKKIQSDVLDFINDKLLPCTEGGMVIHDEIGQGPIRIYE